MLVRLEADCFTVQFPCVTFHFSLLKGQKKTGRLAAMGRASNANERGRSLSQSLSLRYLKCLGILRISAFLSKFPWFF